MQLNSDNNKKLLWAGNNIIPPCVQQAADDRWDIVSITSENLLNEQASTFGAAVLDETTDDLEKILQHLSSAGLIAVVIGDGGELINSDLPVLRVGRDVSADELRIRLDSVASIQPALGKNQEELNAARSLAKYAARTADELDEEMQLASRLQQDFLPRQLPKVDSARFEVFFQPISFVSGDIYDISRLDETHVGFYIADAVGHGLPAALLTMFIKQALQTKRIRDHSYEIVPPHEALQELNASLCMQQLTMCEFCTGLYGIVDTSSLVVTMCRAGHPSPILLSNSKASELELPGTLLGIMEDAVFESREFQLAHGDRLVLYSDGLEDCFRHDDNQSSTMVLDAISPFVDMSRDQIIQKISEMVDSSNTEDDVTALILEV